MQVFKFRISDSRTSAMPPAGIGPLLCLFPRASASGYRKIEGQHPNSLKVALLVGLWDSPYLNSRQESELRSDILNPGLQASLVLLHLVSVDFDGSGGAHQRTVAPSILRNWFLRGPLEHLFSSITMAPFRSRPVFPPGNHIFFISKQRVSFPVSVSSFSTSSGASLSRSFFIARPSSPSSNRPYSGMTNFLYATIVFQSIELRSDIYIYIYIYRGPLINQVK